MQTKDSRPALFEGVPAVRRRRACINRACGHRMTTFEVPVEILIEAEAKLAMIMKSVRAINDQTDALIDDYERKFPGGDETVRYDSSASAPAETRPGPHPAGG